MGIGSLAINVFFTVLGPILVLVLLGALLRWKFRLDVGTLSKLNIYLFIPAFVFRSVSSSTLSWGEMGGIFAMSVLQVATLGLIVWGIGRLLRVQRRTLAAIAMAVMFYNSGNYGLPLAQLAYPHRQNASTSATVDAMPGALAKDGGAAQTFVMMAQNLLTYTIGLSIAAWAGSGGLGVGIFKLFKMPVLPVLAVSLLARWWLGIDPGHKLPIAIEHSAKLLSDAMVPVALVTLGAQLVANPRWPRWKPVSLVLVLRLLLGPLQMAGLLWMLHYSGVHVMDLWPWPAELLILTAGVPTAITTLLLTLEMAGDADLAGDCVFWTTVFSSLTIVLWLIILRANFGG